MDSNYSNFLESIEHYSREISNPTYPTCYNDMTPQDHSMYDYTDYGWVMDQSCWGEYESPFPDTSCQEWQVHSNYYAECEYYEEPPPTYFQDSMAPQQFY